MTSSYASIVFLKMIVPSHVVDLEALNQWASKLAAGIQNGDRLYLQGSLGAGKTTLVRSLLSALGYQGTVKSPTYTLVDLYSHGNYSIAHFDLFRINHPDELHEAGLIDYLSPPWIALVEWPEKGKAVLPPPMLQIALSFMPHDHDRQLDYITVQHPRGETWLYESQLMEPLAQQRKNNPSS